MIYKILTKFSMFCFNQKMTPELAICFFCMNNLKLSNFKQINFLHHHSKMFLFFFLASK